MFPETMARTGLALSLGTFLVMLSPSTVAPARADDQKPSVVSEDVSAALGRMTETLKAPQFSFRARTLRSYAGPNGELLHIAHQLRTVYRRPDKLLVERTGDDGSMTLLYDNKAMVVYNADQKQYASIPVTGGVENALNTLKERTSADFPLADFLSPDSGDSVLDGVTSGGQVGMSTIDGVPCRHLFFEQLPDTEFELWLEDNERSLPRRLVMTYRSLPGRPIFVAELSDWNLSNNAPDSEFEFQPPVGVAKVEMPSSGKVSPPN